MAQYYSLFKCIYIKLKSPVISTFLKLIYRKRNNNLKIYVTPTTLLKMQHSNIISEHIKLNTRKRSGGQIFPPSNLDFLIKVLLGSRFPMVDNLVTGQ